MAGRAAVFGGFAAASLAEAEDGSTVDGEVLFALARIGVGAGNDGADDVHEVAIGPVMAFEQGPEGNDGGVQFAVGPVPLTLRSANGRGKGGSHGFAEKGPFGGVFETDY